MPKTYDLVIIGDTPAGRYAALKAIDLKCRVALVEQPHLGRIEDLDAVFRYKLNYLSRFCQNRQRLQEWGMIDNGKLPNAFSLDHSTWWQRSFHTISLPQLAELGIDIILESGQFIPKSSLHFRTETRKLEGNKYLITTGSTYSNIPLQCLEDIGYLDFKDFQQNMAHLPQNLAIITEITLGLEVAQSLQTLGKTVTLIVPNQALLPQEETELTRYLLAQLEAEGIHIFLNVSVIYAKIIEGQKWLQIDSHGIVIDEVIVFGRPQANLEDLNLTEVGVQHNIQGIKVNQKMQTTSPNIYAVGSVIGGNADQQIAEAEVNIALKNSLGLPIFKINYHYLPYCILTNPTLARVGLTEQQARKRYAQNIIILKQNFQSLPQAQLSEVTQGQIKIITRRNGEILGAHILGYHAQEYIGAIALAIKHKISFQTFTQLPFPSDSFSAIIPQLALQWQQQKISRYAKFPKFIQALFL